MPKIGTLSKKTYFPRRGDMLENHNEGLCWEVAAIHARFDKKSGEKIRYALLIAYHPDFEDGNKPIVLTPNDHEPPDYLGEIDVIIRKKGDKLTKYELNEVTGTWRQV